VTLVARYLEDGAEERLGVVERDTLVDAGPAPVGGFVPTPEAWSALRPAGPGRPLTEVHLLPPLEPRQIVCIGLNYRDHATESRQALPEAPLVFAKLPSAVIGPGEPIVVPPQEDRPDWEAELALVIGTKGRDLAPERALDALGGYTAINDISGRSAQFADGQWVRGKSFDTFAPLGPAIRSPAGVDWSSLTVRCTVSGDVVQEARTDQLIFDVPGLVSYLSRQFTLRPGDVIATGTPAGVGFGMEPQRWLRDGDLVEVLVGDLPPLRNRVVR
jgi:2-keto-4-pentenoate hydratase/2-oxohepta-3-ene-1,7-dioic acid hydratase in catechol pathway